MPRRPATPRLRAGRTSRRGGLVIAALLATVLVVGLLWVLSGTGRSSDDKPLGEGAVTSGTQAAQGAGVATTIEVPQLVGMPVEEAKVLLAAAGLVVKVRTAGAELAPGAPQLVEAQQPRQGTLVGAGSRVELSAHPRNSADASAATAADEPRFVVCIDPGHQSNADVSPEPIGPRSKKTKAKISAGITGVNTGLAEYEIALQVSMNLKRQLEERGVKVVVTRSTNDVNLSNADRAGIANEAKADAFVRIHGGGSPDEKAAGVSVLYPAANRWTRPVAASSKRMAQSVHRALLASTGAPDRGRRALGDQAGFNWSKVPSVLVECGYLSNPVEDRLLASPQYQDRLAQGIADGIMTYLEAEEAR